MDLFSESLYKKGGREEKREGERKKGREGGRWIDYLLDLKANILPNKNL